MLKYSEKSFEEFSKRIYPDGWQFDPAKEQRDIFADKNSQIIVNEIPVDLLFIGDSITYRFETTVYFREYGCIVNRGIGGETLAHLTGRFQEDCLDLKPRLAIVGAGTNDAGELWRVMHAGQEVTEAMQEDLLRRMEADYRKIVAAAKTAGVPVWLASVLPLGTSDFRSRLILRINEVIKRVCAENDVVYVDYHSRLTKEDGITLQDVTFGDDLHPHVKGYNIMYAVLKKELEQRGFGEKV